MTNVAAAAKADEFAQHISARRDQSIRRLQDWVRQPSIAAESVGMSEGCALTMEMLREAGFQHVERIPTAGHPGILATLDAGARRTIALYFMYDVKQVVPAEWSSPPWEARLLDLPDIGRVLMGRGAVNQKGPQCALLEALHAIRSAGRKIPVNLVLVADGEEEIGSPNFSQVVHSTAAIEALRKCVGVYMPSAGHALDGSVSLALGGKGFVEFELVSSAETWGRGAAKDIHSSYRACVDSPAWRLVLAMNSLVTPDGEPAIEGLADVVRPITADESAMLDEVARRRDEALLKRSLGVTRWARDASWRQALEDLTVRPTLNIQGLVGGYTGPGGMTILPHRAAAKFEIRLVPDMTRTQVVERLTRHLANRGFGDIEVHVTGGYGPNSTSRDSDLIRTQAQVYRRAGIEPLFWPRGAGSWPGVFFTGTLLQLPATQFGLGHGARSHAPDEYYLIDPANPKVTGFEAAIRSHVDYLFALARA